MLEKNNTWRVYMLSLNNIKIDPKSLGDKLILTSVSPFYKYEGGVRGTEVIGYRYDIACVIHGLEKISVKIEGPQQIQMNDGDDYPFVRFEGIQIKAYVINGTVNLSATADKIIEIKS